MQLTPWSLWSLSERVTGLSSGLLRPPRLAVPLLGSGSPSLHGTGRRCCLRGAAPSPSVAGGRLCFSSATQGRFSCWLHASTGGFSTLHPPPSTRGYEIARQGRGRPSPARFLPHVLRERPCADPGAPGGEAGRQGRQAAGRGPSLPWEGARQGHAPGGHSHGARLGRWSPPREPGARFQVTVPPAASQLCPRARLLTQRPPAVPPGTCSVCVSWTPQCPSGRASPSRPTLRPLPRSPSTAPGTAHTMPPLQPREGPASHRPRVSCFPPRPPPPPGSRRLWALRWPLSPPARCLLRGGDTLEGGSHRVTPCRRPDLGPPHRPKSPGPSNPRLISAQRPGFAQP